MRRNPPDILITTPESLYLMISSGAREILDRLEAVIVDEIHAVAQSKRGSHLALTLERLEQLVQRENGTPIRSGSASPRPSARSSGSASSWSARSASARSSTPGEPKELDLEIVVPVEDMTEPGARRSAAPGISDGTRVRSKSPHRTHRPGPDRGVPGPGDQHPLDLAGDLPRAAGAGPGAHLDDHLRQQPPRRRAHRQAPERAGQRAGRAGAAGDRARRARASDADSESRQDRRPDRRQARYVEIARAHHGSLSHEERALVEELLKSGQLPCLVATSSLELGIDMGAVDLVIQVESPKSVTRGPAAGRPRRPRARRGLEGPDLPQVPRRPARVRGRRAADARRARSRRRSSRRTRSTSSPSTWSRWRRWTSGRSTRSSSSSPPREPFRELSREQLENVLDMLDGRYPSERFAELRPRIVWDRTERHDPRPPGRPPARGRQRRHDPRPRPLRRPPARRPPRRRARRGDGLRGAPRPDLPARRHHLADRGDHPRPGDRHPGARASRARSPSGAATASAARPSWARRSAPSPARRSHADPKQLAEGERPRPAAPPRTSSPTCSEQQAATRVVPSDETIVVERFRDEIGDWRLCVLSPCGGRVHAAWGLALSAKIRDERELEADAIWSDDGIVIHLPDADEPPPADLVLLEPDELEDLVVARALGLGAVRRPLPRERRRARC